MNFEEMRTIIERHVPSLLLRPCLSDPASVTESALDDQRLKSHDDTIFVAKLSKVKEINYRNSGNCDALQLEAGRRQGTDDH